MSGEIQNIPYYWTALAYWQTIFLFVSLFPKRFTGPVHYGCGIGIFVMLFGYMQAIDSLQGFVFNMAYFIFAILCVCSLLLLAKISFVEAVYHGSRAFITGGFIASFSWQIYAFLFIEQESLITFLHSTVQAELIFLALSCGLLLGLLYLLELKRPYGERPAISIFSAVSVAFIAWVTYILSSISFSGLNTPFGANSYAEAYNVRSMVCLGGTAILYAHYLQLCEVAATKEIDALKNLLKLQYANYCTERQSVELINRRYHDLKQQLLLLKRGLPDERSMAYVEQMEQEIHGFETQAKTGNEVLDIILTAKALSCQNSGINFVYVADGSALDFMDAMNLAALFGNALDNAIEAVSLLEDTQERIIHLTLHTVGAFVSLVVENRCDPALTISGDLPATTKLDKTSHGYGLKSIRSIAESYNGTCDVRSGGGWFELKVLIPCP